MDDRIFDTVADKIARHGETVKDFIWETIKEGREAFLEGDMDEIFTDPLTKPFFWILRGLFKF